MACTQAACQVEVLSTGLIYSTIQAAIDDANTSDGDIVLVGSGTYRENVVVDRRVLLLGENTGGGLPVIDGDGGTGISVRANGTLIRGFRVAGSKYGICITSNNNTVTSNTVFNNENYGIYLNNSSNNILRGNIGKNNGIAGIALYDSSHNSLTGNTVNNNTCEGFILFNSTFNSLTGNTANYNNVWAYGMGIWLYHAYGNTLWLNTFLGNDRNAVCAGAWNNWFSASPVSYAYNGRTYTNYTGNYWGDYSNAGTNGIGASSYTIDKNNVDYYPMLIADY
jgi:parallel beta-helix repeat protein